MFSQVFSAIWVLGLIGIVSSVVLVIAAKFMSVHEDERITLLTDLLPGANCGACGYAGCAGYAEAIAAEEVSIGLCIPGGDSTSIAIAEIMDTEAVNIEEMIAVVRCRGSHSFTDKKFDYTGVESCSAAAMLYKGNGKCAYGCLGFGDCVEVCKFDAITVLDGVAYIDDNACTGCGACAPACPKGVIEVVSDGKKAIITCISTEKGADTRRACTAGCMGCTLCKKECPENAIEIKNNLAVVDFEKCSGCEKCVSVCPTSAIRMLLFKQKPLQINA